MPTNTIVVIIYVDINDLKFLFFIFTNPSKKRPNSIHSVFAYDWRSSFRNTGGEKKKQRRRDRERG